MPFRKGSKSKAKTQPQFHSGRFFMWLKQEYSRNLFLIIFNVNDGLNCKRGKLLSTYDYLLNGNRPKSTLRGAQVSCRAECKGQDHAICSGNDYVLKERFYINRLHFSNLYSTGLAAHGNPQTNCIHCKSSPVTQHQHKRTNGSTQVSENKNTHRSEEIRVREEVFHFHLL